RWPGPNRLKECIEGPGIDAGKTFARRALQEPACKTQASARRCLRRSPALGLSDHRHVGAG
ncbi:MAG: hypothetical protein PVJ53_10265, partial [Desulfobacterales bacterium]